MAMSIVAEARSTLRGLDTYYDLCEAARKAGESIDKAAEDIADIVMLYPEVEGALAAVGAMLCDARKYVWITRNSAGYLGAK